MTSQVDIQSLEMLLRHGAISHADGAIIRKLLVEIKQSRAITLGYEKEDKHLLSLIDVAATALVRAMEELAKYEITDSETELKSHWLELMFLARDTVIAIQKALRP